MIFGKIFGVVLRIEGRFPLPVATNFDEMVSGEFKLIGREFSNFLKDVFFRRRIDFFANLLSDVIGKILGHIPVVHLLN